MANAKDVPQEHDDSSNDHTYAVDLSDTKREFENMLKPINPVAGYIEEAWRNFEKISQNVTLEGEHNHWLACAYYVAYQKAALVQEQLKMDQPELSLSVLLSQAKLSLLNFFQKVKKWSDMGRYGLTMLKRIEQLERNFSVSSIVYEKYKSIFKQIYKDDWKEKTKKSQKWKALEAKDLSQFCWLLYVRVKARYPDICDDLVNSYHLLLCCVDMVFSNVLASSQLKTAIKETYTGVPENYMGDDFSVGEIPSIVDHLCSLHEGIALETKIIKKQYLEKFVQELIKSNNLYGSTEKKTGLLDGQTFEKNIQYLNESYERCVNEKGDVDERVFIRDDAQVCIGTPTRRVNAFAEFDDKERSRLKNHLQDFYNTAMNLPPSTPFTGRRWLEVPDESGLCPITESISKLQELVSGLKPAPSENLDKMFKSFSNNPELKLKLLISCLSTVFLEEYSKPLENSNSTGVQTAENSNKEFAKSRLQLSIILFYKVLEDFLLAEKKKSGNADLSKLLEQDIFAKCLFTCCIEIVLFSYNSSRVFPWILSTFDLMPYYFFKIIELVIRGEDLSREVIKHLSRIEEQILDSLSWRTDSPIFSAISSHGVPRCVEVATDSGTMTPNFFMSPTTVRLNKDGILSPLITVRDRVVPPVAASPVKRNLFGNAGRTDQNQHAGGSTTLVKQQFSTTVVLPPKSMASPKNTVRFPIMLTSPGNSPLRLIAVTPQRATTLNSPAKSAASKKYGSLGIFFRKLYHMLSMRMKDLCEKLEIGADLQKKIWTCFEHSLVSSVELLRDRHLDQLLMCAVYVMCKVTKEDKSFRDIMKWYRTQPQANSEVYRKVLIKKANENEGGGGNQNKDDVNKDGEKNFKIDDKQDGANAAEIKDGATEESSDVTKNDTTESRVAGNVKKEEEDVSSNTIESNVYDDLIQFYNIIYIKKIKDFALKFASKKVLLDAPPLSPLPVTRKQTHSPRKISKQHQVYISPRKPNVQMTPSKMLYCFDSDSPQKLSEINAMIKGGTRRKVVLEDDHNGPSPAKRAMNGAMAKRAQELRSHFLIKKQ